MSDADEWGEPEPFDDREETDAEDDYWKCPNPECDTLKIGKAKAAAHCTDADADTDETADTNDEPDPYRVFADGIDADMKRCSWVNWAIEAENGKAPRRTDDPMSYASSDDATTWASFEDALETAEGRDLGIGFPFAQATPFTALDIDTPRGGDWVPDLDRLGGAAIERSPSDSRRVYLRDVTIPEWWTDVGEDGKNTPEVAVFKDAGYTTVTGDALDGHEPPIGETSDAAFTTWLKEAWRAFNDETEETPPWEETDSPSSGPQSGGSSGGNTSSSGDTDVDVGIYDVISSAAHPKGERVEHPYHGSSTGGNFIVADDGETCTCWRASCPATNGKATPGHAGHLLGMDVGILDCGEWVERDISSDTWAEIYSEAREQGYDIPEQDHTKGDGGDDGPAVPDIPEPVEQTDESEDDGMNVTLRPAEVMAWAGLGEDDDISDLDDRQKAACVWELLHRTDEFHVRVRRDNGSLWAYDRGIWQPEGERTLRHAARKALGSMNYGANVLAELKAQARSDPRVEVEADEFGLATGTVAVGNGLVDIDMAADAIRQSDDDLAADARRELRPDDHALTRLSAEYDPSAEYDEWAGYVEEWTEAGKADALQEYVGYCLHIGAIPIHRALLLVGQGSNGKGTFLTVVRALLGDENTSSIGLQTLANEKDAVADFYGSLANIDDDLSTRKLGQGKGMFKKLIAGDRVRARNLYESGFEYQAAGKHLYAANKVPAVDIPDDDEAFWRRWLLVEFPNYYPPNDRDPELGDRLTEPEALSGVLNWAIEGRRRLLEQGHFTNEERLSADKRRRWQSWGDSTDEFISECVERDDDAPRITTSEAHQRYAAWCRENGEDPDGQRSFTNSLKLEDVGYGKHRINGRSTLGYDALGFSDDVPQADDDTERDDGQERL